ncbi:site-specific integrase [Paenibacillus sp. RRE4]|uniref:site-specific integrase n=1 Tax=Paenibacillus sp. RRE4 TaxID=2962587 RepID=UPI0028814DE8|nr:site-specific integrase [Paenibacillus sp. RRE4]MDT0123929.1 site-specific integrase [Paenibacillus sp. RRE4]
MAKGSIEKRGRNTWRLTVDLGLRADNTRNRPRKTITIEDEALLKTTKRLSDYLDNELAKFKIEVEAGAYIAPEKTRFSDFIKVWHEKYANDPNNLSITTLNVYDNIIESRLIPAFGNDRIDQISTLKIISFFHEMEKPGMRKPPNSKRPLSEKQKAKLLEPLDASTLAIFHRVLKNIFSRAVEWKMIKENPMEGVKKPVAKNTKEKLIKQRDNPQYYDEVEAQEVVDALYKETRKWRLLVLGSMMGGFRRGELIGLEWPEVFFKNNVIRVENNIPFTVKGEPVEKEPKSKASYRDVDMPDWYMEELSLYEKEWQEEKDFLEDKWLGGDRKYVFHNGTGKPYYFQHPSRWWKRFCKRHGIRYIKFHGLRHSSGTLLLEDEEEANFDSILIVIQRRLGHARLSTTSDTYVHVTKKVKTRIAGKLNKFNPSESRK